MLAIFRRARGLYKRNRFAPRGAGAYSSTILTAAGTSAVSFVGAAIISGVFSSAGAATQGGVGGSTATVAGSMAGVGSASFVGAGVKSGALSAAGQSAASFAGTAFNATAFSISGAATSGAATASFGSEFKQIISTNMIQKPIDYQLAGDAMLPGRGKLSKGMMKAIFRE